MARARSPADLSPYHSDPPVHERDGSDQNEHGYDSGLEVFKVAHLEPAGQPVLMSFVIAFEYDQLVETECRDHQRRANQERVHDDQEQAKAVADMGRLPEDARGCPDEDVGAVDEGSGGVEEQEDYRDQHQKPGQGEQALESALHQAGPARPAPRSRGTIYPPT
jgi:hypothetical protein